DPRADASDGAVDAPVEEERSEVVAIDAIAIRELGDAQPATPPADPDTLSLEELREAWAVLDVAERSDGLKLLEQEDAEELFESALARDQAELLLHWRPGKRKSWIRLLDPDDAADVIQAAPSDRRGELLALLDDPTRKEVHALLAYAEDEAGGL